MAAVVTPPPAAGRTMRVGSWQVPVVGPSLRDPRLHLSVVIGSLHVLGQVRLGFAVSVAQILITIAACAVLDAVITLVRERRLVWPASGILTGSGIAFILRASGTEHGDWWSLHGIWLFLLAVVLALASKHLIRPGGRHLFNPSNVALVWVLLVIGPTRVFPQPLWWGDDRLGVVLSYVVLLAGAWWILRRVRMLSMAVAFLTTFAVATAVVAAAGASFVAAWRSTPISGVDYWQTVALSPEVLLFAFFMITDPQTSPRTSRGRVAFGVTVAVLTTTMMWFQPTEFGVKVALLASLVIACAFASRLDGIQLRVRRPVAAAVLVVVAAAAVNTTLLAFNERVVAIERGVTAPGTGQ